MAPPPSLFLLRRALLAAAVLTASAAALSKEDITSICASFPNSTIRIGVITKGNAAKAMKEWPPTFVDYLGGKLAKYGCKTRVVPLDFHEYDDHTREKKIDFLFPNPTCFQEMKEKYGVHEFISVKRNWGGDDELDRFGGTIARRADRHTDIRTLADIKTKCVGCKVCLVNPAAFGGWHIQKYALLKAGLDTDKDVTLDVLGKHEISMMGLFHDGITKKDGTKLNGLCDISVSRTGIIEGLISAGTWGGLPTFNASDVYTISDRKAEYGFPQRLSTVLYPEWPLASLPHVPREFESVVAIPLLSMSKDSAAARTGKHAGFAFPYSYEPVRQLFIAIDHYGNGKCDPGNYRLDAFPRQCAKCSPGRATTTGLDKTCPPCKIGTYTNASGSASCVQCGIGFTTAATGASKSEACVPVEAGSVTAFIVIGSILGCLLLVFIAYEVRRQWTRYQKLRRSHEARMENTIADALSSLKMLKYPVNLLSAVDFLAAGKLMVHEVLRDLGKIEVLDSLEEVAETRKARPIIFFSHQWTGFSQPDPSGTQFRAMAAALVEVRKAQGWDLNSMRVWVDYSSIPQKHAGIQSLAINSLASYASMASAFVIVAPDCPHADLPAVTCDVVSYQRRMWCRAEQICYSLHNGISSMYLATGGGASIVEESWFVEALHVFDGDLTCCRLKHKGMQACDRQSLVVPILGLYAELYATYGHHATGEEKQQQQQQQQQQGDNVRDFLDLIDANRDKIFPPRFTFRVAREGKKQDVEETVTLFGDLVTRMQKHVRASTFKLQVVQRKGSSMVAFNITHGAVHLGSMLEEEGTAALRHGASGTADKKISSTAVVAVDEKSVELTV